MHLYPNDWDEVADGPEVADLPSHLVADAPEDDQAGDAHAGEFAEDVNEPVEE